MNVKTDVTIGLVTYNRLELTKKTIESINKYTEISYRLIVVDNCSTDGTIEYLKELLQKEIIDKLILLKKNYGVAPASNVAWSLSEADFYLKIDNDIEILRSGWLTEMVEVLRRNPETGLIGFNFLKQLYDRDFPIKKLSTGDEILLSDANVGGGCILISRQLHEKLGYWCEDYAPYGEEDVDYSYRARLIDIPMIFLKEENWMKHNYLKNNDEHNATEYRSFKNKHRMKNTVKGGTLQTNTILYSSKIRKLYVRRKFVTRFINEIDAVLELNKDYTKLEMKQIRLMMNKLS
jgi:GT2 family glycosyltransferase